MATGSTTDFTLDTAAELAAEEHGAIEGKSPWLLAWRRLRRNYLALSFLLLFVVIVVICALAPVYSTERMVREYAQTYYVPAARRSAMLNADDFSRARSLVAWKHRMRENWSAVRIENVALDHDRLTAGENAPIVATVQAFIDFPTRGNYEFSLACDEGARLPRTCLCSGTPCAARPREREGGRRRRIPASGTRWACRRW